MTEELKKEHTEQETISLLEKFGIRYRVKYKSTLISAVQEYPELEYIVSRNTEMGPLFSIEKCNEILGENIISPGSTTVTSFLINVILDRLIKKDLCKKSRTDIFSKLNIKKTERIQG